MHAHPPQARKHDAQLAALQADLDAATAALQEAARREALLGGAGGVAALQKRNQELQVRACMRACVSVVCVGAGAQLAKRPNRNKSAKGYVCTCPCTWPQARVDVLEEERATALRYQLYLQRGAADAERAEGSSHKARLEVLEKDAEQGRQEEARLKVGNEGRGNGRSKQRCKGFQWVELG